MSKIGLIIGRELKSKIFNRTFIVMTILAPLLIVGFLAFIIMMAKADKTEQKVLVYDESGLFEGRLPGNDYISLTYTRSHIDSINFHKSGYTCFLWILPNIIDGGAGCCKLYYKKSPGLAFQTYMKTQMEKIIYEGRLRANNIDPNIIHNAKQNVQILTKKVNDMGTAQNDSNFGLIGFVSGALMFMFIIMYGMMVFRSVMEEKTNRIVEVVVSSVKPFELMMGKILGVAILGTLQFIAMAIITLVLSTTLSVIFLKDIKTQFNQFNEQQELVKKQGTNVDFSKLTRYDDQLEVFEIMEQIGKINFAKVFIAFLLYFIGGYLFYSSIMAAIGSAVDSEADSQQFITPVMIPLMIGYLLSSKTIMNPDAASVFWGSIIPFTSPIVMMSRITGEVPMWEMALSLCLLYASFFVTTWLAGKIYRTGILMYGKKTGWKEIGKWLFYKS